MKDLSFINALPLAQQQALLNGPALKPPPGIKSNFTDPPNLNEVGYGVIVSSAIICGSLVILRLYSRCFYHKKIDVEDGTYLQFREMASVLNVVGAAVAALVSKFRTCETGAWF
jgi:hypothetical protein